MATTYSDWENKLFKKVLRLEGGYQDNTADKGNYTKSDGTVLGTMRGITPKTYAAYHNKNINDVTVDQMKAISKEDAKQIYHEIYISKPKFDQLPENIRDSVIDMGINHGPLRTIKKLQKLAGLTGRDVDGKIGPVTIQAVRNNVTSESWANRRIQHYEKIVEQDPTQRQFLKGWKRRANKFLPKEEKQESPLTPQQLEAMGNKQYQEKQAAKMRLLASQRKPASIQQKFDITEESQLGKSLEHIQKENNVIESIAKSLKEKRKVKEQKEDIELDIESQGSFYDQKVREAKQRNEARKLNVENILKLSKLGELGIRN